MNTNTTPRSQTGRLLHPYFVFDTELNPIGEPDTAVWPAAVLTVLRACIRKAHAENRSSFRPSGLGPRWQIARFDCAGSPRLAVFVEPSGETEPCY